MSSESSAADDAVTEGPTSAERPGIAALGALRARPAVVASAVAAVLVALATTVRVLHNVPFDPLPVGAGVLAGSVALAALAAGVALAAVGVGADDPAVRVGASFVGAFGVLGTVAGPARVPAVLAVALGGAIALGRALGRPSDYRGLRRRAVAAGFVVAVACSLAATGGLAPAELREVGVVAYLLALAALSVRARGDRLALVGGGVAFAAVAAATASAPYVAGSALLVAFAVVGAPALFVAAAVAGATVAAVAGVRRRDPALVVGAALLVAAGAPATPGAAAAVILGAALATGAHAAGPESDAPGDSEVTA